MIGSLQFWRSFSCAPVVSTFLRLDEHLATIYSKMFVLPPVCSLTFLFIYIFACLRFYLSSCLHVSLFTSFYLSWLNNAALLFPRQD